jgi:hypothetical protein
MPTDVAAPVESSTAVVPNFDPATYTDAQHTAWIEKGAIPTVKAPVIDPATQEDEENEVVAESTPAVEGDSLVVNEAEATAAKKDTQQQEHKKGKGADARKEELNTEIRELAAKRKAAEAEYNELLAKVEKAKKDGTAVSSTAPEKQPKLEKPVAPTWGEKEGETWEQFEVRQSEHVSALVKYTLAEERQAEAKKQSDAAIAAENKRIEDSWNERVATAKSKAGRDNFAEVAFSKDIPISPAMDGFILDSEIGPEILWYLGNHLDEAKTIAGANPYRAVRLLMKIEDKVSEPEKPAKEAKPEPVVAKEPEKPKPVVVPPTKANKPPTELRAVQAAAPDDQRAAVEADNFQRFADIRNAKDAAKHKKG